MAKLIFPTPILEQHLVVLGKTGAGKSSALRHIAEHLLRHNKRVCVIDPKGDWNGLKVSADGNGPGFPVILFGNFKETAGKAIPADVPLNEFSGKHVAELITSGNRPCVVGLRGWTQGHMHKFWIDFASTLFTSNEGEFYLIVDEVHNFAPKGKIMSPEVGMSLHWTNRIMNEGRGIGLINLIASQRPQKVHNDTLTACETLVAMRVVHTRDRDAVEEWIEGCGDPKVGKDVLNSLAGMKRGEAFVWSPEVGFGPVRLTFPMFETFDSFAPPQLQKKVSGKDWATVDLEAVKSKLASVIEKAKAEDPKELRKQIAESKKRITDLEKQIAKAPAVSSNGTDKAIAQSLKQEQARVAVLRKALQEAMKFIVNINTQDFFSKSGEPVDEAAITNALEGAVSRITKLIETKLDSRNREVDAARKEGQRIIRRLEKLLGEEEIEVDVTVTHREPFAVEAQIPERVRTIREPKISSNGDADSSLSKGELSILRVAVQFGSVTQEQIAVLTGYKATSRREYSRSLIAKGMCERSGDSLKPTEEGIAAAGDVELPPQGEELIGWWRSRLSGGELVIFDALVANNGEPVSKEAIQEATGYKATSVREYTRQLAARKIVESVRGGAKAAPMLFQ